MKGLGMAVLVGGVMGAGGCAVAEVPPVAAPSAASASGAWSRLPAGVWTGRSRELVISADGTARMSLRGYPCGEPGVVKGEPCEKPGQIGGAETVLTLRLSGAGDPVIATVVTSNNPRVPVGSAVTLRQLPAPGRLQFTMPSAFWGTNILCHPGIDPDPTRCG